MPAGVAKRAWEESKKVLIRFLLPTAGMFEAVLRKQFLPTICALLGRWFLTSRHTRTAQMAADLGTSY